MSGRLRLPGARSLHGAAWRLWAPAIGLLAAAGLARGAEPARQPEHAAPTHATPAHGEAGGAGRPAAPVSRFEPPEPGSYALPPIETLADHTLLDPQGRPAPLLDPAEGGLSFVSFIYLSCTHACPAATAVLQQLDRRVREDARLAGRVELVTVSFDPARDTPTAMARFREQLVHHGRWRFLTARSPEAMAPVLEAFGQDAMPLLAADGDPTGKLRHVLKVFLVDDANRVRNIYSAGFLDPRVLANDALTLLGEGTRTDTRQLSGRGP